MAHTLNQVRTHLEGRKGPFFPREVDSLNDFLVTARIVSSLWVGPACQQVSGFCRHLLYRDERTTEDGYVWLWGCVFEKEGRTIIIVFPKKRQSLQRSIAIYADAYDLRLIKQLCRDVTTAFENEKERQQKNNQGELAQWSLMNLM